VSIFLEAVLKQILFIPGTIKQKSYKTTEGSAESIDLFL
jgi:RNA 3'-terminal phosphate cyclase